jgi:hypothetical protein
MDYKVLPAAMTTLLSVSEVSATCPVLLRRVMVYGAWLLAMVMGLSAWVRVQMGMELSARVRGSDLGSRVLRAVLAIHLLASRASATCPVLLRRAMVCMVRVLALAVMGLSAWAPATVGA